jgi:hypothetical protein
MLIYWLGVDAQALRSRISAKERLNQGILKSKIREVQKRMSLRRRNTFCANKHIPREASDEKEKEKTKVKKEDRE